MTKPKKPSPDETPSKAHHVFPAPEWTAMSGSLAAALAHEIRNPLLSIKGAAQLLEQVVGDDDKSLAQLIIKEATRIEQLVATMDPLTPNPAAVSEAFNIHEVTEYVRLAASSFAGDVKIMTHYDPSLPDVLGSREALIQALMNLVKNAVEAVASGATETPLPLRERQDFLSERSEVRKSGEGASGEAAHLQCPPTETPQERFDSPARGEWEFAAPLAPNHNPTIIIATRYLIGERMQRPDGGKLHIQVSVTDNGAGVAEALVARLFTPFASSKEHGKGLGLAITAKIIEERGGLVAYDAPPEGGARFSIYLPVA